MRVGRSQQRDDRHHHAPDVAHLSRGLRGPTVEIQRQHGTADQPHSQRERTMEERERRHDEVPRQRAGSWRVDARKPQREEDDVVEERPRTAQHERHDHRSGDHQHAEEHGEGTAVPPSIARREKGQCGQGPCGELHGGDDSQYDPGGERLSALRQHHGQQQEGHHRHVVASRGQREGRSGQDGDHLQGAHFSATVGGAENSAAPATSSVTRLKKIRASVSTTSCFFSLGYAEQGHDGQVGHERVDDGLAGDGVDHLALGVRHLVVGVMALGQCRPGTLDDADLGLVVGAGIAVGAPDDLEPQRDRRGADEDTHRDGDADDPVAPRGGDAAAAAPRSRDRRATTTARMTEATAPKMKGPMASSAHWR